MPLTLSESSWSLAGAVVYNQFSSSSNCDEKNAAFVFIKPHANTTAAQSLVQNTLKARGITIKSEGELTADQIDKGMTRIKEVNFVMLIDYFYKLTHLRYAGTLFLQPVGSIPWMLTVKVFLCDHKCHHYRFVWMLLSIANDIFSCCQLSETNISSVLHFS